MNKCPATALPIVSKLLWTLSTLPVSTAEAERAFSKGNLRLSAIRASITEDRLEALILMEMNRNSLPQTNNIIEHFASCNTRRMEFNIKI